MPEYILSKSSIVKGLQCEKSLYLHKKHPELQDATDEAQEVRYNIGNKVGELAQKLFPGGKDCSFQDFSEIEDSLANTLKYIAQGETIIYEAAFKYNNVLVFADLLVHDEEGWKMYEVKGSTKVKPVYIQDAAIQSYVIKGCGIDLVDISITHLNNQYVRLGALDVNELFVSSSILDEIAELDLDVPAVIHRLRNVLSSETIPDVEVGSHCSSPYQCQFAGLCHQHIPENSVFEISGLRVNRKKALIDEGILKIEDIPEDFKLTSKQQMQVDGVKSGTSFFDHKNIQKFVSALSYPLHFLDFETFNPAIPLFDYSRPYQQLPFQYSLHVQAKPNEDCQHFEYLAESNGTDPRQQFVTQLIRDCGKEGDVVVYNISFEKTRLMEFAKLYPRYAKELHAIIDRMVDLIIPFRKGWCYTPEMNGSYSIKSVLPALVPELSYSELAIGDGGTASSVFASMASGDYEGDFEQTRADLLAYCELDTLAMVKILEALTQQLNQQ